jgi:uncharacterized protein (DUF2062 family)
MLRRRVSRTRDRVKDRLVTAFVEKHTSQEVAFSFSLGVFITALPTLGVGVLVFFVLAFLFDRLSKIALFASVLILNPVVKWGVYGTSYSLGRLLLGPAPGVSFESVSLSMGVDVLVRLWLGNLILATAFAIVAYVAGLRLINEFRRRARQGEVPMVDLSTDAPSSDN